MATEKIGNENTSQQYPPGQTPVEKDEEDQVSDNYHFDEVLIEGSRDNPLLDRFIGQKNRLHPCISQYINEQISLEEMNRCLLAPLEKSPQPYTPEDIFKLEKKIVSSQAEREKLREHTGWGGRVTFSVGPTARWAKMTYTDLYKDWNKEFPLFPLKEGGKKTDSPTINTNGRLGVRISLGVNPGYLQLGDNLLKMTLFQVDLYGNTPAHDDVTAKLLEFDYMHAISKRSFLEIGGTLEGINPDLLSGQSMEFLNPRIGIAAQLQGTSSNIRGRVSDLVGITPLLSSYTLFRMNVEFSFLRSETNDSVKNVCQKVAPVERGEKTYFPCKDGQPHSLRGLDKGNSFDTAGPEDVEQEADIKATYLELLGEQRPDPEVAFFYNFAFSHYILENKLEGRGKLELEITIASAVKFFAGLSGRYVALKNPKESTIFTPSKAYEFNILGGLRLAPFVSGRNGKKM